MKKILRLAVLIFSFFIGIHTVEVHAETAYSDIKMVVDSSCYTYSIQKAIVANRKDYLTFGTEVQVLNISESWATISIEDDVHYIKTNNLAYKEDTVIKNRVMVSPGAYACSINSTLGYVFYGTNVSVLGEELSKKGVTYVHCVIAQTYEADGVTIKNTNVEGYINKKYLNEKAIPKIVNMNTSLFEYAFGSSADASLKNPVGTIDVGEKVEVLMSNQTWSKVRYNGGEYYMYTNRLDAYKLQVLVNRVVQTYDAKPGSGFQHYVYWNTPITVLNTYESDIYGTYYYCKIDGDYGFIREFSSAGLQYVGYQNTMRTSVPTNMYKKATDNSDTINRILPGVEVIVEYSNDTWAYVNYQGEKGYILKNKLEYPLYQADGKYFNSAYRMYKNNASGNINENVYLIANKEKYGYSYIKKMNGEQCWIKSKSLSKIQGNDGNLSYETNTVFQEQVVDLAIDIYQNWDTKYAHGQSNGIADTDGKYGFDCSGFVAYVLDEVMQKHVPTYNVSANIETLYETGSIYNSGYKGEHTVKTVLQETLDESKLQAGDVLFFLLDEEENANGTEYNHCGLYLGNGEFIHCTSSWNQVVVMPLDGIYERGFLEAKRYLPDVVETADVDKVTNSAKTSVYATKDSETEPVDILKAEKEVRMLFTDNGNWAYVQYETGKFGFVLVKYLEDEVETITEQRYVCTTSLKLYEQPSTSSGFITALIGTQVDYVGQYGNTSYHKVEFEEKQFYVYAPNGIESRLTKDYEKLMEGTTITTITANTKFRTTMSTSDDSNVLRILYKDEKITIIAVSDSGTWTYIKTSLGDYGFVLSRYLG